MSVNIVSGTSIAESLVGTVGDDQILGLEGNDALVGGYCADTLYGDCNTPQKLLLRRCEYCNKSLGLSEAAGARSLMHTRQYLGGIGMIGLFLSSVKFLFIGRRNLTRYTLSVITLTSSLLFLEANISAADTVAETSNFATNGSKIPTSAKTVFFDPLWTSGDATRTAHHELLHAIGFAIIYDKFSEHVDSTRQFRQDLGTGTVLAKLVPAGEGTHIDPNGGTVNGFNQAQSVMGPERIDGQRMAGQEKSILNAGFNWSSKNIKITVIYSGTWAPSQKAHIESAIAAARTLFGSNGGGHEFKWTVEVGSGNFVVGDKSSEIMSIADLSLKLESPSANDRVLASAKILSHGVSAISQLTAAGAKPMAGLQPPRIDVLYSILSADRPGRYESNSFGLHFAPGTTRKDVVSMGERYGFWLADVQTFEPADSPNCYVYVREGKELWTIIAQLMSSETNVVTVNLNYVEP